MNIKTFLMASAIILLPTFALGQTSTSTSTATSTATAGNVEVNLSSGGSSGSVAPKAAVSTAYAPSLTAGFDTCMGSASAGAQGMSFGFSFGSTWRDENCERLKLSRELNILNHKEAALALLCQDVKVADAFLATGNSCLTGTVKPTKPEVITRNDPVKDAISNYNSIKRN